VGDINVLPEVIDAAERFSERPNDEQMRRLEAAFGLEPLFV
jgi:ribosome-binding protein aMBF1 (putative translation factor)